MYFNIDPRFLDYFKNVHQVFLYVTDKCNLRCLQCLYKPDLTFHLKEEEIELNTAIALVSDLREIGASKLTIMGGEPTLYGIDQNHKPLLAVIDKARSVGYEYIRMDTNGTFSDPTLLLKLRGLDEITFSLDGHTPQLNDFLRGKSTFNKCTSNIRKAVELGYHVNITCCIHRSLVERDFDGCLLIDSMIQYASSLGVERINFHDLFKTGLPRDVWTGNFDLSLEEWMDVCAEVQANIDAEKYKIPVRIPRCFVTREDFEENPEYYGYCPAKIGERLLIHPNGIIRICSLLIGTPYGIARFYDNKIIWDEGRTNELRSHKLDTPTPCTNQGKFKHFRNYVPLCVSFKPRQDEVIWMKKLNWEAKRSEELAHSC